MGGSGSGATDELDTDVDVNDDENDADVIEPMEQLPLLLVHGAMEFGGMDPRPIIPSENRVAKTFFSPPSAK
jgi:hypothetical protein